MVRKAIALAIAGMVALAGPALAADAKATAAKAAAVKADTIQRASLSQSGDQYVGDADFVTFLVFGLITTAVVVAAWNDDEEPTSP